MVGDILKRPFIALGFAAFLLLVPLALTSTKGWIRRLGKKWALLHRLVYVAAICAVIHFAWKVKVFTGDPVCTRWSSRHCSSSESCGRSVRSGRCRHARGLLILAGIFLSLGISAPDMLPQLPTYGRAEPCRSVFACAPRLGSSTGPAPEVSVLLVTAVRRPCGVDVTSWRMRVVQARVLSGFGTVVKRRGVGYLGYLLTGVTAPRLAYQFVWGPGAPAPVRKVFRSASQRLARRVPIDAPLHLDRSVDWVEAVMDRAHAAGLTGLRHGLDAPLTSLRWHRDRGAAFAADRDADRCAFNARFGRSILTEASARHLMRDLRARVTTYHDYAPIDFGGGLTVGQIASSDSGTGRWEVFNRAVVAPLVRGRRVLDLGSNNGSMPLMMLRAGARSVVGIEGSPEIAGPRAPQRADSQLARYPPVTTAASSRVTCGRCLAADFGPIDVVTAFCSLSYLA